MKPSKLITDTRPIDQPQESYLNAFNILLNKAKGAIVNDEGFKNIEVLNKLVIYALAVDNDTLVLWSVNKNTEGPEGSEISTLTKNGIHNVILSDSILDFQTTSPIKGVYVRNFKGELVVVYTDGIAPTRLVNIDNIPFDLDANKALISQDNIGLLNLSPEANPAFISLNGYKDSGGQLRSGAYYFTTSYELADGDFTSWGVVMGPVSITEDTTTDNFYSYDGIDSDSATSKAIALSIINIDTRYKYLKVAVIKKIGGVVTTELITRIPIKTSTEELIYTGGEYTEDLILEEVLIESNIYDSAKTLTLLDNTLLLGNLTANSFKEFNYQSIANDITIDWVEDTVNMSDVRGSYKDEVTIMDKRGFFPDEVYAFYVRLHFTNGTKSDGFHIPGPTAESRQVDVFGVTSDRTVIDTAQEILDDVSTIMLKTPFKGESVAENKLHLEYDVDIDKDIKFYQTRETATARTSDNMGVWYNQSEKYPDNPEVWGDLSNTPVRHHKFPSLDVIANYEDHFISGNSKTMLELIAPFSYTISFNNDQNSKTYGQAYTIPLKLSASSDPYVKDVEATDFQGYRFRTDVLNADSDSEGIYRGMTSLYAPLFFYNQGLKVKTVRVTYEVVFRYEADQYSINQRNGLYFQILIGKYNHTNSYFYEPATNFENEYEIYKQVSLGGGIDTIHTLEGYVDIPLIAEDSLSFVTGLIHEDDAPGDGTVSIDLDFYKCELTVSDLDDVNNPNSGTKGKIFGIKASNIVIPDEIAENVEGYEILYAKRDLKNSRVIGQSLVFGSATHPYNYEAVGSHAGNNLMEVRQAETEDSVVPLLRDDKIRFHSFDMMDSKPSISPSFIKVQHYLESSLLNKKHVVGDTYLPEDEIRQTEDTEVQSHYKWDYAMDRGIEKAFPAYKEKDRVRAVKSFKYIPADSVIEDGAETYDNTFSEECMVMDISHPKPSFDASNEYTNSAYGWLPDNDTFTHHEKQDEEEPFPTGAYFLANIYYNPSDLYKSFFKQNLVSTNKIHLTNNVSGTFSTGDVFGGDTFLNFYGVRLTAALYRDNNWYYSVSTYEGAKNIFNFPCYSVSNIGLRHEGQLLKDKYYPNVGVSYGAYSNWVKRATDDINSNSINYNRDYSSLNDIEYINPYQTEEEFFKVFPYRVIKSKTYLPEDKEFSLRIFLSNDYYEMPKNKGVITNLEAYGSYLFINMLYSLFKTASQDRLATSGTEVALGTGELFSLDPVEITPTKDGFAGLQHMNSAVITPLGYLFIDSKASRIYLISDKLDELSRYGNREFFKKHLPFQLIKQMEDEGFDVTHTDTTHNPLGIGYSTVYDSKWDRFVISKKDFILKDINSVLTDPGDIYLASEGLIFINGWFYIKLLADSDDYRPLTALEVTTYFEDKSVTLSYMPADNSWICKHNYVPDILVSTRDEVFSFKNAVAYLHNAEGYAKYYDGIIYPSFVDAVFNPSASITKQLHGTNWISEVVDEDGHSNYLSTLTHIMAYNSHQNTGLIELENKVNIRNAEGTWRFNSLRDLTLNRDLITINEDGELITSNIDQNKPWYEKKRMVDKYVIVRFLYDNISQKTLYLYDLAATFLKSNR